MSNNPSPARPGRFVRFVRSVLFASVCLATLIALFYTVENWRGKRAWLNCKRELEAKGYQLELDPFLPKPVPDNQNIMKARLLSGWIEKENGTNRQAIRIPECGMLAGDFPNAQPTEFPEWQEHFYGEQSQTRLVVATGYLYTPPADPASNAGPFLVVFDDIPLFDAIRTLAHEAKIKTVFGPYLMDSYGTNSPHITVRWENVTAKQALVALLANYGLKMDRMENEREPVYLIEKPQSRIITRIGKSEVQGPTEGILTSITFEEVPLTEAIKDFGKRIGIRFTFNEDAVRTLETKNRNYGVFDTKLSVTWTKLTERQTFDKILSERFLSMTTNSNGQIELSFAPETAADILKKFQQFEPKFQELYAACERPGSSFNRDYKDLSKQEFANFIPFRSTAQSLSLKASAELAVNKGDDALRDIKTCIRLADAMKNEPIIVAGMIRVAIDGLIITPAWEGLAAHRWNDKQLRELQDVLDQIDLIPTTLRCLEANRAYENFFTTSVSQREFQKLLGSQWVEKEDKTRNNKIRLIPWVPRGWIYQNLALENRRFYEDFIDPVDVQHGTISPELLKTRNQKTVEEFKKIRPGNFIASISLPNFSRAIQVIALNQTYINEAIIGCALERYRLQHGTYPEKLETVKPEFLQQIPNDIVNGKPLVYRLTGDGQYLLYSLGWDLKDDNGTAAKLAWQSDQAGDWVWRYPIKINHLN